MGFVAISAGLKTFIENEYVPDTIKEVFTRAINPLQERNAVAEYPIAIVIESDNANDYLDTKENLRVYIYEIWIINKVDNNILQEKWDELRSITDDLIDKLDIEGNSDTPLSNSAIFVEPIPSNFNQSDRSSNEVLISSTVIVRAKKEGGVL